LFVRRRSILSGEHYDSVSFLYFLRVCSEGYLLTGEKIWSLVGPLPPKEKTQLEEKLRRVAGPSNPVNPERAQPTQIARSAGSLARPPSPSTATRPGIPGPASPSPTVGAKFAQPASPVRMVRPESPSPATSAPSASPRHLSRIALPSEPAPPPSPTGIGRPKSMLPSRLGRPKSNLAQVTSSIAKPTARERAPYSSTALSQSDVQEVPDRPASSDERPDAPDDITVTISSILSSDPNRSVEALKRIQRILAVGAEAGPSSAQYRELAEHTEGLIETITLQMAHVFERQEDLVSGENFRLAKHLIQTLNNFCDHTVLAESLTVDILTSLLEELTLRLLETDDSSVKEVKDISRFINMIILRLFSTGRRMSIFRYVIGILVHSFGYYHLSTGLYLLYCCKSSSHLPAMALCLNQKNRE
jgi:cytoskeleton-associated protein 5